MYRAIVVGTDGSPTAAAAVRRAAEIAAATSAELHMVSAHRPPSRAMAFAPEAGFVAPPGGSAWDAEAHAHVQTMLSQLAADVVPSGVKTVTHVIPGAGVDALLDVAEAQGADLIVVGNRGMTGIRRALGSVPSGVAHRAPCDVLIVHTT